jgi:hypothetical protein
MAPSEKCGFIDREQAFNVQSNALSVGDDGRHGVLKIAR